MTKVCPCHQCGLRHRHQGCDVSSPDICPGSLKKKHSVLRTYLSPVVNIFDIDNHLSYTKYMDSHVQNKMIPRSLFLAQVTTKI